MRIKILSPNKNLYEGKTDSVTLPGTEGQFQVLENHAPIFAILREGEIVIGSKKVSIKGGILRGENNNILILAEER